MKRKKKSFDEIKLLEIEFFKVKHSYKLDKLQNTLKGLNKTQVVNKNLHENENEILGDYTGEFEDW